MKECVQSKRIEELENKVQYLEQIVKELIENKVDKEIIRIDENWKPIWYEFHRYTEYHQIQK